MNKEREIERLILQYKNKLTPAQVRVAFDFAYAQNSFNGYSAITGAFYNISNIFVAMRDAK
jgi:hypothetical protein